MNQKKKDIIGQNRTFFLILLISSTMEIYFKDERKVHRKIYALYTSISFL